MTTKIPKQLKDAYQKKRLKITQSALSLFADTGYHSTTISKIAKSANISKGLIYNYFESKEALLEAIIVEGITLMLSGMNDVSEIKNEAEFGAIVNNSFEMTLQNMEFFRLYFSILTQKEVSEKYKSKIMEMVEPFIQLLSGYYANKGIPNPELHALMLGSLLDGVFIDYFVAPDMYPLEAIKQLIIEKFK